MNLCSTPKIGFVWIIGIILFFNTHKSGAQGFDIEVVIPNIKDTVAYLGYHFGDQKFVKDTSKVHPGGRIHFKGGEVLPQGVYFIYAPGVYFELIVNDQKFRIETDTVDFVRSMKIHGSKENQIFNAYQIHMADKRKESETIVNKIKTLDPEKDSLEIADLRNELQDIADEQNSYEEKLIIDNEGSYVSKLLLAKKRIEVPGPPLNDQGEPIDKNWQFLYYRKHFFDNLDLADSGLLRSPVYQPKIDEYMEKLTFKHPDSIALSADYILKESESNRETFRYNLVKLTNKYETSNIMGMEKIFLYLAENYYLTGKAYWADSMLISKFEQRVKELKPNQIGNIAPEIVARDTTMQLVTLSSLPNRYVVLLFYDPDCGHCRKTTLTLKEIYPDLRKKDVEVFAACTVTDVDRWKEYIRKHDLKWINVADPRYHSNFRADYDVKTTPMIYILNSKKEIIAKKSGADQVQGFINRMIEIAE